MLPRKANLHIDEDAGVKTGRRVVDVPMTDTFQLSMGASPCWPRAA
jgi:hypothetical protein